MRVHPSAFKHGSDEVEIVHAWANALGFFTIDPESEPPKSLCIGPDLAGNLLEILYLEFDETELVIHAMPLRPIFRARLLGEVK